MLHIPSPIPTQPHTYIHNLSYYLYYYFKKRQNIYTYTVKIYLEGTLKQNNNKKIAKNIIIFCLSKPEARLIQNQLLEKSNHES